jgi:hypothetical protein
MDLAMSPNVCCRVHWSLDTLVQISAFIGANFVTGLNLARDIQILWRHDNHDRLLFLSINILDHTLVNKALEAEVKLIFERRVRVSMEVLILF